MPQFIRVQPGGHTSYRTVQGSGVAPAFEQAPGMATPPPDRNPVADPHPAWRAGDVNAPTGDTAPAAAQQGQPDTPATPATTPRSNRPGWSAEVRPLELSRQERLLNLGIEQDFLRIPRKNRSGSDLDSFLARSESALEDFLARHTLTHRQQAGFRLRWYQDVIRGELVSDGTPRPRATEAMADRVNLWRSQGKLDAATVAWARERISDARLEDIEPLLNRLEQHPEDAANVAQLALDLARHWIAQDLAAPNFLAVFQSRVNDAVTEAIQSGQVPGQASEPSGND